MRVSALRLRVRPPAPLSSFLVSRMYECVVGRSELGIRRKVDTFTLVIQVVSQRVRCTNFGHVLVLNLPYHILYHVSCHEVFIYLVLQSAESVQSFKFALKSPRAQQHTTELECNSACRH